MEPYEKLLWMIGEGYPETVAEGEAEMLDYPHVIEFIHESGERDFFGPYPTGWDACSDASRRLAHLEQQHPGEWTAELHFLGAPTDAGPFVL